jgi:hypothetical protein
MDQRDSSLADISVEKSYTDKRDLMYEVEKLAEAEGLRQFAKLGTEFSVSSEVILRLNNKAERQDLDALTESVDGSVIELQNVIDSIESDLSTQASVLMRHQMFTYFV